MLTQTARKRESKEEGTAYHESGHAIVSRITWPKLALRHVTIIPNALRTIIPTEMETLGYCLGRKFGKSFQPDVELTNKTRDRLEAQIMSLLAGKIAEERFTGRKSKGSEYDLSTAASLASNMSGDGKVVSTYLAYLWARTENLVYMPIYWKCITALAKKLLNERRVSGKDVDKLIRDVIQAEVVAHRAGA
jgi:ATP-dependent Zn protease